MTPRTCLGALVENGIDFRASEGNLKLSVPSPFKLPEALLEALREAKQQLVCDLEYLDDCVFLAVETRASEALQRVGVHKYVTLPSFEVVCISAALPDGTSVQWSPRDAVPERLLLAVKEHPVVAHDAYRIVSLTWARLGWPRPLMWIDTLPLARLAGLPVELDALGRQLLRCGEDTEGRKVLQSAQQLDRSTHCLQPLDDETRHLIGDHCRRNVQLLKAVWAAELARYSGVEDDVQVVDSIINDRGFLFDVELARSVIHMEHELAKSAVQASGVSEQVLSSPAQFLEWLRSAGIVAEDVCHETLESLIARPGLQDHVARAIHARLLVSGHSSSKLKAGLRMCGKDGRVRGGFQYLGAHTGRWTGEGMQPQNLPRGVSLPEDDRDELIELTTRGEANEIERFASERDVHVRDALSTMVRACIVAPPGSLLVVADFSQIEARVAFWLAKDPLLSKFETGPDPYSLEGAGILGGPLEEQNDVGRLLGKAVILGCIFGGGAAALQRQTESLGLARSDLKDDPEWVVEQWRDRHPAIAGRYGDEEINGRPLRTGGIWRDLEKAARNAIFREQPSHAGRCVWYREGSVVHCRLPSGRVLVYPGMEFEPLPGSKTPTLSFIQDGTRKGTWGGVLAENITQAVARDLLAHALVQLEADGMRVVLHVHDEVVCEVDGPRHEDRIKRVMENPPDWASGLPLHTKTFSCERYRK